MSDSQATIAKISTSSSTIYLINKIKGLNSIEFDKILDYERKSKEFLDHSSNENPNHYQSNSSGSLHMKDDQIFNAKKRRPEDEENSRAENFIIGNSLVPVEMSIFFEIDEYLSS